MDRRVISAEKIRTANRLLEGFGKEQNNMAELPEHVKAKADAEMAKTGMQKAPVQDMDAAQAVDNYPDGGKALEAMREQKRQDALMESDN